MNALRIIGKGFERLFRAAANIPFMLIHKELTDEIWDRLFQFIKFCFVGLSNTAISLAVYYIFIAVNRNWYIAGNAAGFIVSVLNSYFWNSRYVFKKKDEVGKTMIKTFAAYSTNLAIGTALLYLFVDILHISEIVAPLLNLVITVPLNFILNKVWVMK